MKLFVLYVVVMVLLVAGVLLARSFAPSVPPVGNPPVERMITPPEN